MSGEKVAFRVKRFNPADGCEGHSEYEVPPGEGMTVLEGLWHIVEFIDGSLSFRYSCRGAVCGSCAMRINGTLALACHTRIAELLPGIITVEPLPYLRVIKDLVVDMEPFMEKFRSVRPFVSPAEEHERELLQSPRERRRIDPAVNCILCASCHSACPIAMLDADYLGPAALTAAQRFAFDSRSADSAERLRALNNTEGTEGCMKISRCTTYCPREIAPSDRIEELREAIRELSLSTPIHKYGVLSEMEKNKP